MTPLSQPSADSSPKGRAKQLPPIGTLASPAGRGGTAQAVTERARKEFSMKAVVTRVSSASVVIDGVTEGAIDKGYLVLLGVGPDDTEAVCDKLAEKICNLRVFEDENGKMNLNLEQVGGSLLVVSQFTLYADTSSRRPGFTGAAKPDKAIPLYERFMDKCRERGFRVEHGQFGADMKVSSVNDGPVTILFDM